MLFGRMATVKICSDCGSSFRKMSIFALRNQIMKGQKMRRMLLLVLVVLLAQACKKPVQDVSKGLEGVWICKTLATDPAIIMDEVERYGELVDEVFCFDYSTAVKYCSFKILPNNRMYLLKSLEGYENGHEVKLTEEELIAKKYYWSYTISDNGKEAVWEKDKCAANFKFNMNGDELEVITHIKDWVIDGKRGSYYDEIIKNAKQYISGELGKEGKKEAPLSEAEKQMVQKVLDAVEKAGTIELKFTFTRQK